MKDKDSFERDSLLGHLLFGKVSTVLYLAIIALVIWGLIKVAPHAIDFLKHIDALMKGS